MSAYAVSARGLVSRRIPQGVLAPMNALLFGSGQQGAWYDPSDLSTLFQDSAGTTPVTAVEQPVGRMLDKSGNGNHAFQATSTKRGVVSRRVNLLTKTEQFDDAAWQKSGGAIAATVTANTDIAPDGTLTADSFVPTASDAYIVQNIGGQSVTSGMKIVAGIYTKSATRIIIFGGATPAGSDVYSIQTLAGGWYLQQVVRTFTATATGTIQPLLTGFYTGAGSYVIWGASLTLAVDAHLPYQWVNTATDYDADPNKFPTYIRFDGVDDAYQTNSIDFTGTDKMTVWAGVTKLSDAAVALIAEFGMTMPSGGFYLAGPNSVGPTFGFATKGTVQSTVNATGQYAPISAVLACSGDIAGDIASLRVNGVATTSTTDQGAGNYGNYPLDIGARAGTSLFFNGRLYSLIVRGAATPLAQIEAVENIIKKNMRLP